MHLLDSEAYRKSVDVNDVYRALGHTPEQAAQAWHDASRVRLPRDIHSVVVAGMGGSALGAHILQSAFRSRLRLPFSIVNGYDLPGHVGRDTLVILSSYSGTTEEVLSAFDVARQRKARIAGVCTGGTLARRLSAVKAPAYVLYDPKWNPGNVPRYALGYSVFSMLAFLNNCGALQVTAADARTAIMVLHRAVLRLAPTVAFAKNPAKQLAAKLKERFVLWVGAEHVEGSLHAAANMTNESGKHFGVALSLPEINHHLLEGLAHPKAVIKKTTAVMCTSKLYHPRVAKRFPITARVFAKNGITTELVALQGRTELDQALEAAMFGAHATYYLGLLHRANPSPNPWVDYFKKALGSP